MTRFKGSKKDLLSPQFSGVKVMEFSTTGAGLVETVTFPGARVGMHAVSQATTCAVPNCIAEATTITGDDTIDLRFLINPGVGTMVTIILFTEQQ